MRVVVSTGAGISKASGLPVYRGEGGTWTDNPELEAKSTREGAANYLEELWNEWGKFRELALSCYPNAAHYAIADWQIKLGANMWVVTQNVDRYHKFALSNKAEELDLAFEKYHSAWDQILTLHGDVWMNRCLNNNCDNSNASWYDSSPFMVPCEECGGDTRPDIVLFGEDLKDWNLAQGACLGADLYIAVGTSGTVYPASELVTVAKKNGARTLLVNTEPWEYPHPDFDEIIIGKAEEILSDVLEREIGQTTR